MQQAVKTPASFDPAEPGTPESVWLRELADRPEWSPKLGPLIVVSPHPDDEVLGAGGLIHSWATAGHPVTVVSVTDGEAAFPQWKGLDRVRRDELQGALRRLCPTHIPVVRVGLPDGRVREHVNRLRNALLALIDRSVTLIAPFERDGHPDHDAVGEACCALARTHGIPLARYPIWSWHHAEPADMGGARWAKFSLSFEARRVKARAVQCFASQLRPPGEGPIVPPHVLSHFERAYEAFLL